MSLTQDKRIGQFTTPLGKDTLVLVHFDGTEGLSELFEYQLETLSEQEEIDFNGAIGRNCSLTLKTYDAERTFNGVLVEAQWLGPKDTHYAYRLVLRPWLWLLSHTSDCRIFHDQDVKDIIKKVFSDRGFNDFRLSLTQSYPKLEYCVQYRETDLAFVSRLMEQHGIYYFFEHSKDKHMLVLADSTSSHKPVPGRDTVPFIALAGDDRRDREHIYHWTIGRRFRTGVVKFNDFDFVQPNKNLIADAKGSESYAHSSMEIFDHLTDYKDRSIGEKYAKVRLEAEQAHDHRRHGTGDAASLFPGGLTKLEKHIKGSENIQYLIIRATHSFVAEAYRSGGGGGADQFYHGTYEFLSTDRPFRAPLVTPKPQITSMHTARVVGKEGEEIDTDEHGRIRVEFFWDRKKSYSRWARVAQVWAHKQWGFQFIPRIGMEVIVAYEEGDPDYPLVIGSLYNGENKYPYKLPDNKTQSGIKSNSSKGGNGYNELMFEDLKGSEEIHMHAEKDHNVVIRHAETTEIGETFEIPMGSPSRETTLKKGDDQLTLETGNQTIAINMGSQSTTAMMSITLTVGLSTVTITPAAVSIASPVIDLMAEATINLTSPIINITGVVNLTGMLNITGGVLVNGMVPMLLPA